MCLSQVQRTVIHPYVMEAIKACIKCQDSLEWRRSLTVQVIRLRLQASAVIWGKVA